MTINSARKGRTNERALRDLLTAAGIKNRLHGIYEKDDITAEVLNEDWPVEAKVKANGFRQHYKWLENRKLLFTRADRKPWLVTLRADDLFKLIGGRGA